MKKLKIICAIMIIVGFGISFFSIGVLEGNQIVAFAGVIIALVSGFIILCIRDEKKKSDNINQVEDGIGKKADNPNEMSEEDMKIVEFINGIDSFYDCTYEIIDYKSYNVKERPYLNWIRLNDDNEIEKALIQYAYVKSYFDEHNSSIVDLCKYNPLAAAWSCNTTFLIVNSKQLDLSEDKERNILILCIKNNVKIVFQNKNAFVDIFNSQRYILKSYKTVGMTDSDVTGIVYKLDKVYKQDFISDTVNYLYDSRLLLSDLKNKCSQNASNTEKELTDEDDKWQGFIDGFRQRTKKNDLFFDTEYSAFSEIYDGIESKPDINWIKLRENADLIDAVNYYLDVKKYIESYSAKRLCIFLDTRNLQWLDNITFLVLNDNKSELTDDEKNNLLEKCKENNIYIVKQKNDDFIDLFTSTKYSLMCSTCPGMADDAATYAQYSLIKTYNTETSREEKISEKILYQILTLSNNIGIGSAQYNEDLSLSQINIKIQLDESKLYFLTVYVNSSNGMIKHFSFDIEYAGEAHYEFGLNDAQCLIERMICASNDEFASRKSISGLMIDYMNSFGNPSIITLIEDVITNKN